MKAKIIFAVAFTILPLLIGLAPDPPHQPEPGTMTDAYLLMVKAIHVNPAYGRVECPRLSGTPCPRPKPAPSQYCPFPPGGTAP